MKPERNRGNEAELTIWKNHQSLIQSTVYDSLQQTRVVKGTILAFVLAVERESREASEESLDGYIRWPKLQFLETPKLFLTLLWLRESSLLDKHMAGCEMGPTGPVGRSGTAGRNPEMKMQRLPGAGRCKCLIEGISMMVNSRVE